MTPETALTDRWQLSQVAGYAALTAAGAGSERVLGDGAVRAFRVPAMAEVSVSNGVVIRGDAVLGGALDELAKWYAGSAWSVWLAPWQVQRAAPTLERHGLQLEDEPPRLMAGWLAEMDLEPRIELDLAPDGAWADLADVVDAGFGMPAGLSFRPAFAGTPPPELLAWVARVDGEAVASAVSVTHAGDCWFALVATLPEHRGRGLSAELIRTALRAARAAGCDSTSLEASAMARSGYARIGYRDLGPMQIWEHDSLT